MKSVSFVTCAILAGLSVPAASQLRLSEFVSGLSAPVGYYPDPTDRKVAYVMQQNGRIRRIVAEFQDQDALAALDAHLAPRGFERVATGPINARFELPAQPVA